MKYIVVLGDGMADEPLEALDGRTPLEVAETPVMDDLAGRSEMGMAANIPEGMKPGSDTANLAVLGYYPKKYYSGRSPPNLLSSSVTSSARSSLLAIHVRLIPCFGVSFAPNSTRLIIDGATCAHLPSSC